MTRGKELKATRCYNDSASVSSATSSASRKPQSAKSSSSSRAGSSTMSTVPRSVSSFTPESGDESDQHPPRLIDCSWPGCSAKALPRHPICQAHQQNIFGSASPSAPQPQPPRISPDRGRTHPLGIVKPNKLLPENDKDRPILRRKTAQRDPFMPIQPSSNQSTPSVPGDSFTLSLSPKQTFPRPLAHSPPDSPNKPRDAEPVRKRQKVSHALNGSSESRPNGTHALNPEKGEFDLKHKNAKVHSHASYAASATRPGRGPETEKNGFRLSSNSRKSSVSRKMAAPNLRLLNGLGAVSPGAEKQPSSTEFAPPAAFVNGSGPSGANTSNRTLNQTQNFHGNKGPQVFNQPANSPHFSQTTAATNRYAGEGPIDKRAGGRPAFEPNFQPGLTDFNFSREHSEQHIRPSYTNGIPRTQKNQQPRPRETKPAETIYPIPRKANLSQPLKMIDETAFDNLIYRQEGASTPPPEVIIPEPATRTPTPKLEAPDEPVFANVDPRIHWTLPQSESWLRKKQEEINARGGRKVNFGKAAVRMKQQRLQDGPPEFEETLPDKILDNPVWTQALKKLESEAKGVSAPQGNTTTTRRKPGPKPGQKRQLSNASGLGPGPESAHSMGNEQQTASRSG